MVIWSGSTQEKGLREWFEEQVRRPPQGGGVGLPHGVQHLLDGGLEEQALPGHLPAVHQDHQLAPAAVHQLHFETRLLPQGGRQTGGVLAGAASDRALPDGDLFHHTRPFREMRASPAHPVVQGACHMRNLDGSPQNGSYSGEASGRAGWPALRTCSWAWPVQSPLALTSAASPRAR
jgi:hypothetical protein